VSSQTQVWWFLPLLPAFVIYIISMVGETNRLPFDLPEAEGELVSGYMTEYSSMKFAWFFLAEYINMLNVSAVATTLFFGGWRAPFIPADSFLQTGWWPVLWFLAKLWFFMFLFVWIRGSVLRFRYDQFMKLGWKVLIPAALTWVVCVAVVQGVRQFSGLDLRTTLFVLAGVVLLGLLISFAIPEKKKPTGPRRPPGPEVIDPFAGGYPVPPLPGQVLPPSPRKQRLAEAASSLAAGTTNDAGTDVPQEVHGG
jgi:NADH-quinone oxidoreductase subunit H